MKNLALRLQRWSPQPKMAGLVIVVSSLIIVASLVIIFAVLDKPGNGDAPNNLPNLSEVDGETGQSVVFAKVEPFSVEEARLYVEEYPDLGTSFTFACVDESGDLVDTGSVELPYTALRDVPSGQLVSCSVASAQHASIVAEPFKMLMPETRTIEDLALRLSMGGVDELLFRAKWAPVSELTERSQLEYYIEDSNGSLYAAGSQSLSLREINHPIPVLDSSFTESLFISVRVVTNQGESSWVTYSGSFDGEGNGEWVFEVIESNGASETAELESEFFEEDPSRVYTITSNDSELIVEGEPGWIILSEERNLSNRNWLGILNDDNDLILPIAVLENLNYSLQPSPLPPRPLRLEFQTWYAKNVTYDFKPSGLLNLEWEMVKQTGRLTEWKAEESGTFVVTLTDLITGVEKLYVGNGLPKASFSNVTAERPYAVSFNYADMSPKQILVADTRVNLLVSLGYNSKQGADYSASFVGNILRVEVKASENAKSRNFWVQVRDEESGRILFTRKAISGVASSYEFDLNGKLEGDMAGIRITEIFYDGSSHTSDFSTISARNTTSALLGTPKQLEAEQIGGKAVLISWKSSNTASNNEYAIERYSDGAWKILSSGQSDNTYELVMTEDSSLVRVRVRERSAEALGNYGYLTCTLNNSLFCD